MRTPAPSLCWVELSGENPRLAREELRSVLRSLGEGALAPEPFPEPFVPVSGTSETTQRELARRLAHARALYRPLGEGGPADIARLLGREGSQGATARLRVARDEEGNRREACLRAWGDAYRTGGGRIDLTEPERVFRVVPGTQGPASYLLLEQVEVVDRTGFHARRPSQQTFRQPVTLSPRLARTLVNLSESPLGGTVLDPFCGTGAIPREARLLGHPVVVSDRSAKMLRGTLQNLAAAGISPETAWVADVSELPGLLEGLPRVSALVTDPPYGRASSTGGEGLTELLARLYAVLPAVVGAEGTGVLLLPHPDPGLPPPTGWRGEALGLAERVHGSLSRYVYRLTGPDHASREGTRAAADGEPPLT